MGTHTVTVRLSEDRLAGLRRRYPGLNDSEALRRAVEECVASEQDRTERERAWAALDGIIGMVHGDGSAGSDEHNRWTLGADA